jgi:PAS domain S-box-containing protein
MKNRDIPLASPTDEGRYRLLVESIKDYAVFMLDPDGIVTSWNSGAQRIKGYTASEIIGSHFSRFYSEVDRLSGLPTRALETSAREGKFEMEGWRIRKDGTRFWAHVVIDPIWSNGALIGYSKITRDLSERKAAAQQLKQSEEQFKVLVQSVTDYAIFMLDPDGYITSWNMGAQRIKGYLPNEIIGEHFSRFYTDEDKQKGEPERALATCAQEGRFEKLGWRLRKDGTRFWANVVLDSIRDENGKLIGFAKVTRDISERRALEETREALIQSQKLDAIGQLTGGIAHDFNNLLMAVLSSLELMSKRLPKDPKIMGFLDNAIEGAKRGASLTQRMLAFARRQELKPEAVDVPNLVRGMTELLQRSLGPMVSIETHFPLALASVRADANQLELALLNLAMNARDAMPQGGPIVMAVREEEVTSGHHTKLPPGRYACISVMDIGEGMDETTLAKAVEPFFTTKGLGKGTGLGLPMVQGMTTQLGGKFVLTSQVEKGTTAEIWLPCAPVKTKQASQPVIEELANTGPLVVLAVDDDGIVLLNTIAMLEELGHTALEATSGKHALEILERQQSVDLVITDQGMPRMTGLELADAIQAKWSDLPVILASGYAELPARAESSFARLAKPFDERELARVVSAAIRRRDAKRQSRQDPATHS